MKKNDPPRLNIKVPVELKHVRAVHLIVLFYKKLLFFPCDTVYKGIAYHSERIFLFRSQLQEFSVKNCSDTIQSDSRGCVEVWSVTT